MVLAIGCLGTLNNKGATMTKQQQEEAVRLFNSGVKTYTKIAGIMDVPYKEVNAFMTKWKRKNGLLKKHKQIAMDEFTVRRQAASESPEYEAKIKSLEDEVKFLRSFYLRKIG